jgi:hypothetical protein
VKNNITKQKPPALGIAPISCATNVVNLNEPCFGLFEINLQSPGSRGFHRYQILYVVRGDKLSEAWLDMGLAKKFKVDQFRIPGGVADGETGRIEICHTVGELMDIADFLRINRPFDKRELVKVNKVRE